MKIKIEKEPYNEGEQIFTKNSIDLKDNTINCVVGCNGSGKTTLLTMIEQYLRDVKKAHIIECDYFGNALKGIFGEEDGKDSDLYVISFDKDSYITYREFDYFFNTASKAYSSTGENIVDRFCKHVDLLGDTLKDLHDCKLFVFFDDCDAGTSIDMIDDIKQVFNVIKRACEYKNITYYILISSNSFEMVKDLNCISVHDFSNYVFNTYDEFKTFVCESRMIKNKRFPEEDKND